MAYGTYNDTKEHLWMVLPTFCMVVSIMVGSWWIVNAVLGKIERLTSEVFIVHGTLNTIMVTASDHSKQIEKLGELVRAVHEDNADLRQTLSYHTRRDPVIDRGAR